MCYWTWPVWARISSRREQLCSQPVFVEVDILVSKLSPTPHPRRPARRGHYPINTRPLVTSGPASPACWSHGGLWPQGLMWEVLELILQPGQVQGLRGGCRDVVKRAGAWPGCPEFTSQLPWLWSLKQLVASRSSVFSTLLHRL